MASKSLGTLTLDLVAKVGGFVQGMDKAERSSAKWRKQVEQSAAAAGAAIGAASAVAVGAMAVWVKSSIDNAAEIQNLARVAGTSTTEFQKFAAGARTVGIENDKLSDILKDVNDKVGEFITTGGGELKDFFEQVAPKVGVTAEQFRDLSGPQALGLYVDALEKAGANQQQMTFFLEAIADEASSLAPLLRDGGKELRGLADEAQSLGLILSDETIAGAKQFNDDLDLLGRVAGGVGQQIAAELLPELLELTGELRKPETAKAAADMAKAVVGSFTTIINGARNTVQFIQWAAESAAAFMNGIAADDIVRLNDEIERLEKMKASGALDRLVFFGRDGIAKYYNDEELDAELATLRGAVEAAMSRGKPVVLPIEPKIESDKPAPGSGLRLDGASSDEAAKAAEKAASAITRQVEALQKQADTIGMSSEALAIYNLEQAKASDGQMAQARAALETISAYEKQKEQTEAYAELVASLRTEEEQLTDQMRERLAVLDAMQGIEPDDRMKVAGRIAGAATEEAPDMGGIAPEVGGVLGELDRIDEAESKLEEWYERQLEMLDQFRKERADLSATWDEEELAIKQQHEDGMARIEKARQLAALSSIDSFLGNMIQLQETGSKKGKAIAKAAAIVQTTIKTYESATSAFSAMAGIPYVGPALGAAAAAAAVAAGMANVAAIQGMAHEGIDSIPQTGTWLLEKGERVTTANTSAKLDKTLSDIQSGNSGTGQSIQIINNGEPMTARTEMDGNTLRVILDRIRADIMSDGTTKQAISQKFGIEGVGR
ncbi:phage tail tape measure protein [Stutzerimonas stutzeri]|uniref:phage tail tape measure protein n=1 Tax=Stutzerimonas stutzeri TaxID=316 RepID=UPI001C2EBB69|nr:phage tail tape measure protein [Stutzerimonas stutzeri]